MALLAGEQPGSRGPSWSSSTASPTPIDSDVASLAGAKAAREVLRTPLPAGMGTPQSRTRRSAKVLRRRRRGGQRRRRRGHRPATSQPGVGDVHRGRARGRPGQPRQHRRLPRLLAARRRAGRSSSPSTTRPPRHRSRPAWPARSPRPAAGARDHQVARAGRARPRAARSAASRSPDRAGCSPAPTGCGTTPPSPSALAAQVAGGRRRPTPTALALDAGRFANARGGHDNITAVVAGTRRCSGRRRTGRMPATTDDSTSSREEPTMAEFTAAVYQNEFLPDGGTDVNAIVTVTCTGAGTAGQSGSGDGRRDHHRRHLRLDGPGDDGRGQGRRAGGAGRDRRRHLVRGHRRHRPRDAGLPAGAQRAGPGADGRRRPAQEASAAIGRLRRQRRYGDRHLARPGRPVFASVPQVTQRHAILLTDGENGEQPGQPRRGDQPGHRLLPVRLPRRRHRLEGRGDPPHRAGAARHRRHHPDARRDAGAVPGDDAGRRWPAASPTPSCGCGRRRAPRCCSSARSRRPSRTSPTAGVDGQPAHRRLSRPAPGATSRATTTSPSGSRPRRSARSSSPRGCSSRSATTSSPRAWSRRPGPTTPS